MPIYIVWTEKRRRFSHWRYAGNGVTEPVFESHTVNRRLRFSNGQGDQMQQRAEDYLQQFQKDHPNALIVKGD